MGYHLLLILLWRFHFFFLILGNGPITVSSHTFVVHVFISCGTILAVNPCFVDFCCHTTLAAKNLTLPFKLSKLCKNLYRVFVFSPYKFVHSISTIISTANCEVQICLQEKILISYRKQILRSCKGISIEHQSNVCISVSCHIETKNCEFSSRNYFCIRILLNWAFYYENRVEHHLPTWYQVLQW